MAAKIIGEIVASIPYPGGTRYVKCGALLELDNNDTSKGPGFLVMLDRYFNPAGIPDSGKGDGSSVALSVYHPKPKEDRSRPSRPDTFKAPPHKGLPAAEFDDDIPF